MKSSQQRNRGFTLIELMIVIAIVAILVSLAVPAYQDYVIRSKVTECIAASAPVKTSISEFRQSESRWPASNAEAGMLADGAEVSEYCEYFLYHHQRFGGAGDFLIMARTGADESGLIEVVMSPEEAESGVINWNCTRLNDLNLNNLKYLPASCRDDPVWRYD